MSARKLPLEGCACLGQVNKGFASQGFRLQCVVSPKGKMYPALATESLRTGHALRTKVACRRCPFCGKSLDSAPPTLDKMPSLRLGILKEVRDAFDLAIDMCGCHNPETLEQERAELARLRREVLHLLRDAYR